MIQIMKRILVICAHPDDEVLGLGGTLLKMSKKENEITVLFFTDGESARNNKKNIENRKMQAKKVCAMLGIKNAIFLNFEDQTLDIVPLKSLAKEIENVIEEKNSSIIYTHFWGDLNQDHRRLYEATMIASRPHSKNKIKQIICYETPSSTEYGLNNFLPNHFVDITSTIKQKMKAVSQYVGEIKKYPHPRSKIAIRNRAKNWGATVGLREAEAFVILRDVIE